MPSKFPRLLSILITLAAVPLAKALARHFDENLANTLATEIVDWVVAGLFLVLGGTGVALKLDDVSKVADLIAKAKAEVPPGYVKAEAQEPKE